MDLVLLGYKRLKKVKYIESRRSLVFISRLLIKLNVSNGMNFAHIPMLIDNQ
jgi:hypothetical protein